MRKLKVNLGERSYWIFIAAEQPDQLANQVAQNVDYERVVIISDTNVWQLYGETVTNLLCQQGLRVGQCVVPAGENSKSLETVSRIYDYLLEGNYPRQTTIIALGGGVPGDIAGFIAATYMRGVKFIQLPTTLLAMVDSSVGGKTGVNHPLGKNMIGAFYQPALVYIHLDFLRTLPEPEMRNGMAEVIKYGIIKDDQFFHFLEENLEALYQLAPEPLGHAVERSCQLKAWVVENDERERGLRAILNYGHTFGHALELWGSYERYSHGEAVALGMTIAARLAQKLAMCSRTEAERVEKIVSRAGLPTSLPSELDPQQLYQLMGRDKKVLGKTVRFVLPRRIGEVEIRGSIEPSLIWQTLEEMRK